MDRKFYFLALTFLSFVVGQYTDSRTYDFRDGTIITNGQSTDGSLTLTGNYSHHGATYGLNMKVGGGININVNGSSTIRFLGSAHSGLNMLGTAATEGDLGEQKTKVANDLSDTYDFVYSGPNQLLNFKTTAGTGNDLYLPEIEVIPAQSGAAATAAEKNIIYYYDFRDGSIIPTDTDGKSTINMGLIDVIPGSLNAYGYNGTQHGAILKEGNQIVLQVAGNSYIKVGGSIYSNGTISVSSATGNFDITTQNSVTSGNFSNDGSTVDFLYAGTAGTVTLDFTGTTYIPYIEVVAVPYDVVLEKWVQKAGTVTVNGKDISYAAGADASTNPTVTVSAGTVISATPESASVYIDLSGNLLTSYTPSFSGDISSVEISNDSLFLSFSDETTNPKSYIIKVKDNSQIVQAEPGKTYTYPFYDGSELPKTSYQSLRYSTFVTSDGIVTINSNTDTESLQFGYHDSSHGGVFFPGNSFDITVAGNATITFIVCTYGSATDAVFEFTDPNGSIIGSIPAQNIGGADGFPSSFSYTGPAGVITATLKSPAHPTAEIYIHALTVENAATIEPANGKTDVWDFGAVQLDGELYNNKLNEETINSWYDPSITVGSSGNVLPTSFSAGALTWLGGGNDRLRTTNTNLTRYDENIGGVEGYTGRIYVNSAANTGRYLSLTLSEDDEVTLITKTDAGGIINFKYVADPQMQTDQVSITSGLTELNFVAKEAGTYHIFDTQGKPSYFRIYRKDASYKALSGAVDLTNAVDIPAGYSIIFTNEAGKSWSSGVTEGNYSVNLPEGYNYSLSLEGANGYIITSGNTIEVTEATVNHDIVIQKVDLYTVTGSITGLGTEISNLHLDFKADPAAGAIYQPTPVVDVSSSTYTVQLEPNIEYTISATGVNDFYITDNTITIGQADQSLDIIFAPKPLYNVTIDAPGLTSEQLSSLELTFTNLAEEGYQYTFTSVNNISLRNGTYSISYSGLDAYPLEMALTSNLTINGADATKTLTFDPVKNWSFDDKVIANGTPAFKGLLFTGNVSNEISKGHLNAGSGSTIQVPVSPGEKITVTYYYTADFSIDGGESITTNSKSTGTLESVDYVYQGAEDGYATITMGSGVSTTYITNISIGKSVEYASVITVGTDKEYPTINAALDAVASMIRENNERVTIMIDPGNYEEMLVINQPNVTLKNTAENPDIDLLNKGVDISDQAVRITSYYGHGYSYYSMGTDQKWHADILQVNKENGYLSYKNKGAGTTNQSYWNATVVVTADGFHAEDIIFENSFNQYISKKESEDVVVMWETGSKGERPTDYGNTAVQQRSYVERAAAIAITNNVDKVILKECRVVGRQDSFFGGAGSRVVVYRGAMMGAVDYIFGGMTAVFYRTDLVMNTSDLSSDRAYLTAAQQSSGRGFLMYETHIRSAEPGIETASQYLAAPGYFGRPWQATTSEVVFYKATVDTTNHPGFEGQSLIMPEGWQNSLGGESSKMYEYGTIELSGVDNSANRAAWSTVLTEPILNDGTEITTFNFTKGDDGWDPIPALWDTNNALAELIVEEGTLSPAFDPEVTSYSVELPANTTHINIQATPESEVATVDISSIGELPATVEVTVTAEDGSSRIYRIDVTMVLGIDERPDIYGLRVYPNPMSSVSTIVYRVPVQGDVNMQLLNLQGAVVKELLNDFQPAGEHQITLKAGSMAPGIYICNLRMGAESQNIRLIVK